MAKKQLAKDLDNGYQDVSAAVEQSEKDVQDVKRDEDGIVQVSTEATAVVSDELSRRAAGAAEGGGPWPASHIGRFLRPQDASPRVPEYSRVASSESKSEDSES